MENIEVVLIVVAVLIPSICYIVKAKRKKQCIGCPYAKQCSGKWSEDQQ